MLPLLKNMMRALKPRVINKEITTALPAPAMMAFSEADR